MSGPPKANSMPLATLPNKTPPSFRCQKERKKLLYLLIQTPLHSVPPPQASVRLQITTSQHRSLNPKRFPVSMPPAASQAKKRRCSFNAYFKAENNTMRGGGCVWGCCRGRSLSPLPDPSLGQLQQLPPPLSSVSPSAPLPLHWRVRR